MTCSITRLHLQFYTKKHIIYFDFYPFLFISTSFVIGLLAAVKPYFAWIATSHIDIFHLVEYRSPCDSNPCQNGGRCSPVNFRTIRCNCSIHYTGQFCQCKNTFLYLLILYRMAFSGLFDVVSILSIKHAQRILNFRIL